MGWEVSPAIGAYYVGHNNMATDSNQHQDK